MGRKIVVAMINIAVGLFTAYMFIVSDRETKISTTQSNIACEIINLDLRSGSRHHLTSSLRTPKFFVKEFCYFLMSCHQHCLGINLLVQR